MHTRVRGQVWSGHPCNWHITKPVDVGDYQVSPTRCRSRRRPAPLSRARALHCCCAATRARGCRGQAAASVTRLRVIFALTVTRRPRTNLWGVSSASTESMAAGRSDPPSRVLAASLESSGSCCCLAAALRRTGHHVHTNVNNFQFFPVRPAHGRAKGRQSGGQERAPTGAKARARRDRGG